MSLPTLEPAWISAFEAVFRRCKLAPGDLACLLTESRSRPLNIALAEAAMARIGARFIRMSLPTPPQTAPVPIRSTGASRAIAGHPAALAALAACPFIVDLTVEGLLHAPELKQILGAGSRVLMVSNEHPDALERLVPTDADETIAKAAVKRARAARRMQVTSAAGTDLLADYLGAGSPGRVLGQPPCVLERILAQVNVATVGN